MSKKLLTIYIVIYYLSVSILLPGQAKILYIRDSLRPPATVGLPAEVFAGKAGQDNGIKASSAGMEFTPAVITRSSAVSANVDMGKFKNILTSLSPSKGETFSAQLDDILSQVDKILRENNSDKTRIVKQDIYIADASLRRECEERLAIYHGEDAPATSYLLQPPADGSLVAVEITAVPKNEDIKVTRVDSNLIIVEEGGVRWAHVAGIEPDAGIEDAYDQSWDVFTKMKNILESNGFSFNNILRTWIFLGDITKERYQKLNDARWDFFAIADNGKQVHFCKKFLMEDQKNKKFPPASTGIGMLGNGLLMQCVAIDTERDDVKVAFEGNPEQEDAFSYSRKVLLETESSERPPSPPLFSRQAVVYKDGYRIVFVSGTASIKGEGTVFLEEVEKQTEATIDNIEKVLGQEGLRPEDIAQVRVYIRNIEHYELVQKIIEKRYPGIICLPLIASVCRSDLLVEIEVVAYKRYQAPASKTLLSADLTSEMTLLNLINSAA